MTFADMNADDIRRLRLKEGDLVSVAGRRGAVSLPRSPSLRRAPGSAFIACHLKEAAANLLTDEALDPHGKVPELKVSAVRVAPAA